MAIELTSATFEQEVVKSDKPVIIDVFATWCGPCRQMGPIFEELSKELVQYKFAKINVDEERDLVVPYNVSSIPTFVFIKNGALVAKEMGAMTKDKLKEKIIAHLG